MVLGNMKDICDFSYVFKTHEKCDAEAKRERALAGGRGDDSAGRVGPNVLRWAHFLEDWIPHQ
jgi:hypothetical protein